MSTKKSSLPTSFKQVVSSALAKIPVSSFNDTADNKVVEVSADSSIAETVELLARLNIFSAPVKNANVKDDAIWSEKYMGIVDYGAIILWVLEQADLSAVALAVGSATAAGVGTGAVGALGALALGATGPAAIAGLTLAGVGAAIAGGLAVEKGVSKDAPTAVDALGEDFYKIILREEPFKSIKVSDITKAYRWTPFLPIRPDDSMLTLLLLLSMYRLRSVPVVEMDKPDIKSFITQAAVVKGLSHCKGRDWFDEVAGKTLHEVALPVMGPEEVVSIDSNKLVLEAFVLTRERRIGGLPVLDSQNGKIVGNISLQDVQYLLLKADLFARHRALTVLEFMEILHSQSSTLGPVKMMPAVTCSLRASLGQVIDILCERNIHRIYVTDDDDHVVGVITLRDIISCFVVEPSDFREGYFDGSFKNVINNTSS
ncbi:hypothetical protein GOP47_0007611 [Adiantum capillus-veneris]|uniref:CBS domain-containing protein n=1 Tax=Adiantum capillus-veneris TaxID=13818 RepID=A0A9D4V2I0_ADICA|nr:hypothetical protein GOP47_0007611 [Adiantum capillus-veneris]